MKYCAICYEMLTVISDYNYLIKINAKFTFINALQFQEFIVKEHVKTSSYMFIYNIIPTIGSTIPKVNPIVMRLKVKSKDA